MSCTRRDIPAGGFAHEAIERSGVVDVVPERQLDQVQTEHGRTIPRCRRDGLSAPGDVSEQACMWSRHAEKIIPTVITGTDRYAPLVASKEK